jgi:MinD-like ATPase involved in chromosome partitioning or flagellar assembly
VATGHEVVVEALHEIQARRWAAARERRTAGAADAGAGAPTTSTRTSSAAAGEGRRERRHDAEVLLAPERLGTSAPAEQGWRGLLNRAGLRLPPGPAQLDLRADLADARAAFPRPVTVVVANPKGGSGKTPTALLLAGALGQARGGGVLAWDNNELRGNMAHRSASHGQHATIADLLPAVDGLTRGDARWGDLSRFLRHQGDGQFDVLASQSGTTAVITREQFDAVHAALSRFVQVIVVDTGNSEAAPNWRAALAAADQLVVPVKWKRADCLAAARMLEDLERQGLHRLVDEVIVVATNGPGDANTADVAANRAYFTDRSRTVIDIPTDPHIHVADVLEHNALRPDTQRAALALAAAVARGLTAADRHPTPPVPAFASPAH